MSDNNFYIKRVQIKGLFGTKDIDWELNKDVNILGGINGSGKSTVIQLIYSAYTNGALGERSYFDLINLIQIDFTNTARVKILPNEGQLKIKFRDPTGVENIISEGALWNPNTEIPSWEQRIFLLSSAEHQIASENVINSINKNIKTTLDLSLYDAIVRRNELLVKILFNGNASDEIQDRNLLLRNIINSFFVDTNKQLAKNSSTFEIQLKDKTINCYQLSTGEKQLLLILLTAFNSDNEPCILLMDEPDLGIHIDWKKNIVKSIRVLNPNAQLILSTHSPSMIEGYFDKVKNMNEIATDI